MGNYYDLGLSKTFYSSVNMAHNITLLIYTKILGGIEITGSRYERGEKMRNHCEKCKKKTTETWNGRCQECIDKHAVMQESHEVIEDK